MPQLHTLALSFLPQIQILDPPLSEEILYWEAHTFTFYAFDTSLFSFCVNRGLSCRSFVVDCESCLLTGSTPTG